jgi:hypothetical protein
MGDFVFTPKDRHRVRVVRQPDRLFVLVDDKLISTTELGTIPELPPLKLDLAGTWGKDGMLVYFDNLEIRTPLSASR